MPVKTRYLAILGAGILCSIAEAEENGPQPFSWTLKLGVSPSKAVDAFIEGPTVADGFTTRYVVLAASLRNIVGAERFDAAFATTEHSDKPRFRILPDGVKREEFDPVSSMLAPVPISNLEIKTGPDKKIVVQGASELEEGDLLDVSNSPEYFDAHRHTRLEKAYLIVITENPNHKCRIGSCHFTGLGWETEKLAAVLEELLAADNQDRKERGLKARAVEEWLAAKDSTGRHAGPAAAAEHVDASLVEKNFPMIKSASPSK